MIDVRYFVGDIGHLRLHAFIQIFSALSYGLVLGQALPTFKVRLPSKFGNCFQVFNNSFTLLVMLEMETKPRIILSILLAGVPEGVWPRSCQENRLGEIFNQPQISAHSARNLCDSSVSEPVAKVIAISGYKTCVLPESRLKDLL